MRVSKYVILLLKEQREEGDSAQVEQALDSVGDRGDSRCDGRLPKGGEPPGQHVEKAARMGVRYHAEAIAIGQSERMRARARTVAMEIGQGQIGDCL